MIIILLPWPVTESYDSGMALGMATCIGQLIISVQTEAISSLLTRLTSPRAPLWDVFVIKWHDLDSHWGNCLERKSRYLMNPSKSTCFAKSRSKFKAAPPLLWNFGLSKLVLWINYTWVTGLLARAEASISLNASRLMNKNLASLHFTSIKQEMFVSSLV